VKHFGCVAIVGVGLIGGSIGLALRKRNMAERVMGIGRRQESLRIARRVGAVTNTCVDLAKGVAGADLVVVCTPVGRIVDDVRAVAQAVRPGTLITDAGSTKRTIVEALDDGLAGGCRFLGSHPLAGGEKAGPGHADADLFEGRVTILTPTKNTRAEDFDLLEEFWSGLGSMVIQMPADEHDRVLAITSHLPHAAAAMLASLVPENCFRFTGAGLLDTTRIAAGDPDLWQQIFLQNRENLLAALGQYELKLQAFIEALRAGEAVQLRELLAGAKVKRDALGS
jgi:prephenate dehydrogenase